MLYAFSINFLILLLLLFSSLSFLNNHSIPWHFLLLAFPLLLSLLLLLLLLLLKMCYFPSVFLCAADTIQNFVCWMEYKKLYTI